jgi:hypothetical protein
MGREIGVPKDGASVDALVHFASPGALTELGVHVAFARALPAALPELCGVVQGLVLHPFMTGLYGLTPDLARNNVELELRGAGEMLAHALTLDARPLAQPRPSERRLRGNCRHFTLLLTAILRARGTPARARCGFAAYFEPRKFVDHWVCEVWDAWRGAWHLVDAQLDDVQRKAFRITFDPLDVPRDMFVVAGDAWQRIRSGRDDAQCFGILDLWGAWFVRGNLVRDVAAFAKRELLPWDCWGLMNEQGSVSGPPELALLDRLAALTLAGNDALGELLALQASESGLRVPGVVQSAFLGGKSVKLAAGVAN